VNPEAPKPFTNLRSGEAAATVKFIPGPRKYFKPVVEHDSLEQTVRKLKLS
jgi:hypothetical protein